MMLEEIITKDIYHRKFSKLQTQRYEASTMQDEHHDGNEQFKTALSALVMLSSKGSDIFRVMDKVRKRELLVLLFSNFSLHEKNLGFSMNKPFDELANLSEIITGCKPIIIIRTQHYHETLRIYQKIPAWLLKYAQ